MTEDVVKKGYKEAEKSLKEAQVAEVKNIVTRTLEKLDSVRKDIAKLREEEKILKLDIEDLKGGRLDRISERQNKDPEAKKISVVLIIKEKTIIREQSPWYQPYTVVWQDPVRVADIHHFPNTFVPMCENNTFEITADNTVMDNGDGGAFYSSSDAVVPTISCSVAKDSTIGAYNVSGHVVHLR